MGDFLILTNDDRSGSLGAFQVVGEKGGDDGRVGNSNLRMLDDKG